MSLQTRIESLVIRLAQEFNTLHAKTGTLASLSTTDKSSLVAAVNELQASIIAGSGIDDDSVGLSSTYSSTKIVSLLDNLKAEIVGGADAAYDTLLKIQQLLQDGTSGLDALLDAVNRRVRFDAPQLLSSGERQQALDNIGATAADAVGSTDTDFVAIFEGALV